MPRSPTLTEVTRGDVESDADPAVVGVGEEGADDLLASLTSSTARTLLQRLHDSPTYASELADETDTSLQNVHYHLGRLEEAGAVEVVDTVYSEKGREMSVYAPTAEPLVIVAGSEDDRRDLVETLSKLLGAVGVLALASVAVQELVERLFYPGGPTQVATEGGAYAAPPTTNVAPPVGLLVFVAGLALVAGWVAWRR